MKNLLFLLIFIFSFSSCDYSQLKKENTLLKNNVDSLSFQLNNASANALRFQMVAIMQQHRADSAVMVASMQKSIADSIRAKYVQLLKKTK